MTKCFEILWNIFCGSSERERASDATATLFQAVEQASETSSSLWESSDSQGRVVINFPCATSGERSSSDLSDGPWSSSFIGHAD